MDQQDAVASDAYVRGRRDGKQSLSPSRCPFPEGSAEALDYWRGWQASNAEAWQYANQKPDKEWWADRQDFDCDATSGARLRAGT